MTAGRPRSDHARIVALTKQGMTAPQIAEIVGVTARTVARVRALHGCQVCPPPTPLSAEEVAIAEAMLADGCNGTEVARTLGRGKTTVLRRWSQYAWSKQQVGQWAAQGRLRNQILGRS